MEKRRPNRIAQLLKEALRSGRPKSPDWFAAAEKQAMNEDLSLESILFTAIRELLEGGPALGAATKAESPARPRLAVDPEPGPEPVVAARPAAAVQPGPLPFTSFRREPAPLSNALDSSEQWISQLIAEFGNLKYRAGLLAARSETESTELAEGTG